MTDPTSKASPDAAPRGLTRRAYALGAGSLLLAACGGGSGNGFAFPIAPAPAPEPKSGPELAVEKLDALVNEMKTRAGVPGVAVSVVYRGKTLYAKGFGERKKGETALVDADTVFQLASVSKSLSATVVARQVGEGKLSWNSPVRQFVPEFELSDPRSVGVTVGQLFSHRSGLGDHAGDQLEELGYKRNDILARLRHVPVEPLGSTYEYTNFGLTAGAEAAARAAGIDWDQLSERTLYLPLGMSRTSSRFADFAAQRNRAVGHMRIKGQFEAARVREPDEQSPAGGASSTANDMARWMTMVLDKGVVNGQRLIDATALQAAMTAQPDSSAHYGYGFNVGRDAGNRRTVSHSGAFFLGAATMHMMWPDEGLGITVLTNAQPVGLAEAIGISFGELAFGAAQPSRDWLTFIFGELAPLYALVGSLAGKTPPASPQPPQALAAYTGHYANAYYGNAYVEQNGGRLQLVLGPQRQVTLPLTHWDGNQFVFYPDTENAPEGSVSWVRFNPAAASAPAFMDIEYYSQDLAKGRFDWVDAASSTGG